MFIKKEWVNLVNLPDGVFLGGGALWAPKNSKEVAPENFWILTFFHYLKQVFQPVLCPFNNISRFHLMTSKWRWERIRAAISLSSWTGPSWEGVKYLNHDEWRYYQPDGLAKELINKGHQTIHLHSEVVSMTSHKMISSVIWKTITM